MNRSLLLLAACLVLAVAAGATSEPAPSPIPTAASRLTTRLVQAATAAATSFVEGVEGAEPDAHMECATGGLEETDHYALVNVFQKLDGGNWSRKDKWNSTEAYCTWQGVTCGADALSGRVVGLDLSSIAAAGNVPEDFALLTQLVSLNVSGNALACESVAQFSSLSRLQTLDISGVELKFGFTELVNSLGHLVTLVAKDVKTTDTQFGPFRSASLQSLQVENLVNPTSGNLAQVNYDWEVGLPSLTDFRMNAGKGKSYQSTLSICTLLENAPRLTRFEAQGTLSDNYFDLSCLNETGQALKHLEVSDLSGDLRMSTKWHERMSLETLIVRGTKFNERIFSTLSLIKSIVHVDMSSCALGGLMPLMYEWRKMPNLRRLELSNNKLVGGVSELSGLPNLEYLDLSQNEFFGGIVDLFSSPALKYLNLRSNRFFGPIPTNLGAAATLEWMDLGSNKLNICAAKGALKGQLQALKYLSLSGSNCEVAPEAFTDLPALTELDLSGSGIKTVPDSYGSFPALVKLVLRGNKIEAIPAALKNSGFLQELDLAENAIVTVPRDLLNVRNLSVLRLERNKIADLRWVLSSIVQQSDWRKNMKYINLDGNPLSKENNIDGFASLAALEELHVAGCGLAATINSAAYFTMTNKLEQLRVLDLSGNALTSAIPDAITRAPSLTTLNLSSNKLTGALPAFKVDGPLVRLHLENNELTGKFALTPSSDPAVTSKIIELHLENNKLAGPLPAVGSLPRMSDCNVAGNVWDAPSVEAWKDRCTVA